MVAIISQARVNSSRLPNKIFLEAGGKSFLLHHVERLEKTSLPLIIATTNDGSESPIVAFCENKSLNYYKSDENDVLKRYYETAKKYGVTTIIRVTSDCPLIDPQIILKGLQAYKSLPANTYYSNALQRTYPRGMDYEIFSFDLLKDAFDNATEQPDREHVTPYIWKNRSGKVNIAHDIQGDDGSTFRVTLDTKEDQEVITKLIEDYRANDLDCGNIVKVLRQHPGLVGINKMIEQKKI